MTLAQAGGRRQFRIDEESDSANALMLFSLLLSAARDAEFHGKHFEVSAGALLVWQNCSPPTLEDLRAGAQSGLAPGSCPPVLRNAWYGMRDGAFMATLKYALQHAATFEISDARQICRLLAGVAQTLLTVDSELRSHNLLLAQRYQDAAMQRMRHSTVARPEPARTEAMLARAPEARVAEQQPTASSRAAMSLGQPYAERVDERGGYEEADGAQGWFATSRGPRHAAKPENQDAAYVVSDEKGRMIFATADGVSTSTGARFGAAATVFLFCQRLCEMLKEEPEPGSETLLRALSATQLDMDGVLNTVLENWEQQDFREVYADMPRESAKRLLSNTRSPKKSWPPGLSSTLIGGFLARRRNGLEGFALRLGDGVIERVSGNEEVTPIFGMDSEVTAISAFFGPGPLCAGHLGSAEIKDIRVESGELLLISSDGLTRGHSLGVYRELQELLGAGFARKLPRNGSTAHELLELAGRRSDELHESQGDSQLFADNLALTLICPTMPGELHG